MPYPLLHTPRLVLRRPRLSDAAEMVPLLNDREVARFIPLIPQPYTRRDWAAWMRKHARGPERRPEGLSYPFTIEMGGRIIGNIGYRWDAKDRAANIGYIVGEKFRRQGIATEAARAITDHAFAALKAERVWATVIEGNRGSLKVLRNCGMRLEGVLRKHTVHRGRRVDLEHYSVLRSEWKRRRSR